MRRVALLFCNTLLLLFCGSASGENNDSTALKAATHSLCPYKIAMLGETATHGDGHTEAFKVQLVKKLIDECGFNNIIFEASHYEFLNVARKLRSHQTVSTSDISRAVGGLWNSDQEFQSLLPFLLVRAQSGKILLGGLDDQLGEMGQDYANSGMVAELVAPLPTPERLQCSTAIHQRIFNEYTSATPYSAGDRSNISRCLVLISRAIDSDGTDGSAITGERLEAVASIQRWLSRDFKDRTSQIVERDESMWANFEWLESQEFHQGKTIIWAASVHIAKQAPPGWGDGSGTNFGSLVTSHFGSQAFSLGFSALSGTYRMGWSNNNLQPAPPAKALAAEALQGGSETVYIDKAALPAFGSAPAAVFQHSYTILPWAKFLDGLVVFATEYPPQLAP